MNAVQKRVAIVLFFFALVATIVFSVGFATPSWVVYGEVSFGLWQECTQNLCYVINFRKQGEFFLLVLALECLGMICLLVALLLSACLLLSLPIGKKKNIYSLVAACLLAISSICSGAAIFASTTQHQLSYSFILVLVAAAIEILVGSLACLFRASR